MNLDLTQLGLAALSVGFTILGWVLRTLWSAVKELQEDLNSLRVKVAQEYTPLRRFEDVSDALNAKLDKVLDLLKR
jgi:hypothetical protein